MNSLYTLFKFKQTPPLQHLDIIDFTAPIIYWVMHRVTELFYFNLNELCKANIVII